jgi:MFS family permease
MECDPSTVAIRTRTQPEASTPPTETTFDASTGMMHSLRVYAAFRMLMAGTLASSGAFWMYQVAVGWLALELTDSPLFVGLAGFAGGIPMLIVSMPAGVLIDRMDRRLLLFLAQFGVMLTSLVLVGMIVTDVIRPWSLLVLLVVNGTVMSFTFPTRNSIVPSLVEKRDLANAVALNAAVQNSTRVVGPSLAGVMIAVVDLPATFAFAAVLQTLAMFSTLRLTLPHVPPKGPVISMMQSLAVGVQAVRQSPPLIAIIFFALAPTVLVMPYINLMPVFARDELGLGSTGLGVLLAAMGLGTVFGALHVARSAALRDWNHAQLATAMAFAVFVIAFAATPFVPLAAFFLFVAGWASAAFMALNQTSLQLQVEDAVRGRVMSIYLMTWGVLPIGQLAVGSFADVVGTPVALVISCSLALVTMLGISRRYPLR